MKVAENRWRRKAEEEDGEVEWEAEEERIAFMLSKRGISLFQKSSKY